MREAWQALQILAESLQPGAGGDGAAARRAAVVDWARPLELANRHLLGPAMYTSLRDSGALSQIPEEVRGYLEFLYRCNGERNAALRGQVTDVIRAFNAAGIRPMLLKGSQALFVDHYADPNARMIRDLDVLVPAADIDAAVAALEDQGYRAVMRYESWQHAYGDFVRPNDPGAVDLHLEILDARYLLPAAEVWDRSRRVFAYGVEFHVPAPGDALLHLLLHAEIHYLGNYYRGILDLRQLHEFAILARRYRASIDWEAIRGRLTRYRLDVILRSYAFLAQRLFGLPWPLAVPPGAGPRLHHWRCIAQLLVPDLESIGVPLANLRSAFAWHRMNDLYAGYGPPSMQRFQHAMRFLRKTTVRGFVGRLFRA